MFRCRRPEPNRGDGRQSAGRGEGWKTLSVNCLFSLGSYGRFLLFQTSEAAPVEDSNPPISPSVNIKEEPIDEGYDAALLPQSSIRQIKEELEHQEVGIERRQRLPHCIWIEAANRLNCFITMHRLIILVVKFKNIPSESADCFCTITCQILFPHYVNIFTVAGFKIVCF